MFNPMEVVQVAKYLKSLLAIGEPVIKTSYWSHHTISQTGMFNPMEVVQVAKYLKSLLAIGGPVIKTSDIGVITPYCK